MTNNSIEFDIDTTGESSYKIDYLPPISLFFGKDGRCRYNPVHYEKKLTKYDLSVVQCFYTDGTYGELRVKIKIDDSDNIIKSRWELLDL